MPPTHLPAAPITEAVLEIQVNPPAGEVTDLLSALQSEFSEFSVSPRHRSWAIHVDDENAKKMKTGVILLKENKILQARVDGFAFSQLVPYLSWDIFQSEARALWERYRHIVGDVQTVRFGLRYVNRI